MRLVVFDNGLRASLPVEKGLGSRIEALADVAGCVAPTQAGIPALPRTSQLPPQDPRTNEARHAHTMGGKLGVVGLAGQQGVGKMRLRCPLRRSSKPASSS